MSRRKLLPTREIRFIPQTKEDWLREIPKRIETLHNDYHFYWSQEYHRITDINKTLSKKKDNYKGKMCLYVKNNGSFYFTVYCKKTIYVYYLRDNYLGNKWNRVKYFISKWRRSYGHN